MSDLIDVFDQSMLSQHKDCPRKFYFRYVRHLIRHGDKNYVTGFGSALHDAYAAWYQTGLAEEMDKAFINAWTPFEGQDETGKRTFVRGLTICKQYREQFTHEPFDIVSPEYIEVGFSMELGRHIICGKMDGIVQWKLLTEGLVVLEHKFSNSPGYLCCDPNFQLDTYIWAAARIIGQPIIGAYFNLCYHQAKDITKNTFSRELTWRVPEQIEEWELEMVNQMDVIDESCRQDFWPRNTKHCGAYYRECEYIRLCRTPHKDEREEIIPLLFKEERWNPYPDAR